MTTETTDRAAKSAGERQAIERAMAQLLAEAQPGRRGWPSVSQLAVAAGVKRWVLTHKHTDLQERFRREIERLKREYAERDPEAVVSPEQKLERDNARLRRENAGLREQASFFAQVLNELTIDYEALKAKYAALEATAREEEPHIVPLRGRSAPDRRGSP